MSVAVNGGATVRFGPPRALFNTGIRPTAFNRLMNQYAVSLSVQRFLLDPQHPNAGPGAITAVVPW